MRTLHSARCRCLLRALLPAAWVLVLAVPSPPLDARLGDGTAAAVDGDHAIGSAAAWVARLADPDTPLLTPHQIREQNARLLQRDGTMHDLAAFPASLPGSRVRGWLQAYNGVLQRRLFHEDGSPVNSGELRALQEAIAAETVPEHQPTRYGLVVRRAPMRAVPSAVRAFSTPGDTDIDRFQESAEFPGTPVVIAHASRDRRWLFVVSARYAAWMPADAVAEGTREAVLGYANKAPFRVITDAKPRTVFTREEPRVSELQLDMGVRMPLAEARDGEAVNGQHPHAHWVLQVPVRTDDGRLAFASALLPHTAGSADDFLPLTRRNLVTQAFRFLGERYGWGHSGNGRDCSGFVAEVYRSMGVQMPRNTGDQARSPAFRRTVFDSHVAQGMREAALAELDTGDLIYIPGHVMMMLGRIDGQPYVIHDTHSATMRTSDGGRRTLRFNGVVVTPLEPLLYDAHDRFIDRITTIVHMREWP